MEEKSTYKVPSGNIDNLTVKLEKLNKRARKIGCQPVELTILEKVVEEDWYEPCAFKPEEMVKRSTPLIKVYYLVEIIGEAPKYNGWTFVGTLQYTEGGNILRAVTSYGRYRAKPSQLNTGQ